MLLSRLFHVQNDSGEPGFKAESPMQQLEALDLQVFSATWCPDCRRLEAWLEANGVAHAKVDIETVPGAAERLEAETGKRAIPFILVNGKTWVRGYHRELPQRFDPDTLVRELLDAAGH
jgi:glutaredoxin